MEEVEKQLNTVKKSGFFSHVFKFDEDTKNEMTNMVQYLLIAIIPVIVLNKLMENVIPQYDESKGNLELLVEVVGQVSLTILGLFIIHRIITFIPSYSGSEHKPISMVTLLIALLILNNNVKSKMNLLFDRVNEMLGNKKKEPMNVKEGHNHGKNNVQVVQNVAGANSQAPQVQQQQAGGNPYLTQHTPPQGGPQEQPTQGFEGLSNAMMPMATEPMAANAGFGAFSGF